MTYTKPEITVLGDAAHLILNGSGSSFEPGKLAAGSQTTDGDLDD